MMIRSIKLTACIFCLIMTAYESPAQKNSTQDTVPSSHPDTRWFREAKFGIFMHWGLYSMLEGQWKDSNYYGSGEWLMYRARIPAAEYAAEARRFNPVDFNGDEWAKFAKDAGARYLVITAKHHEGFAMYDSKVSDFTIAKASPYKKDPMKSLAAAIRNQGLQFGFYYSQYQDWHEANGGGNDWDFDETKKDYQRYYKEKSVPQLKELLSNYGPLGIVWFDTPGGLTREQTQSMIDSLRRLQPHTLFSSRVGQGLGDYIDFGDSETPSSPIDDAWEAIYTHNDSWGYIANDKNFKSPTEIIRLLAVIASKGGNLMLNIGPDGKGRIPEYSRKYLLETGEWLRKFGESIYGSSSGFTAPQPWGVSTSKPGKLYLHVFERPHNGLILVPGLDTSVKSITQLDTRKPLNWFKKDGDIYIKVPELTDKRNTVLLITYNGHLNKPAINGPVTVSSQYNMNALPAALGKAQGNTTISTITFSHYFGDWKHETCAGNMKTPGDAIEFNTRITDPGDYKLILEYTCPVDKGKQEGVIEVNGEEYHFETLPVSDYQVGRPLLFIQHPVAIVHIDHPGLYTVKIHPFRAGNELFKLKTFFMNPVL